MKDNKQYSKRFRDYPKNVPIKLLRSFRDCEFSISVLSKKLDLNMGYVSALLRHGKEPSFQNTEARRKLFLPIHPICPTCKRKILKRTIQKTKREDPPYLKIWKHLEKDERQKVIQEYLAWKEKQNGNNR